MNLKIVSVSYSENVNPNSSVSFTVVVKNNESTAQFAEVDVTIVNRSTGIERTLTPVLTGTVPAGGTLTLSGSYTVSPDTYTVSFPLFDGNGTRTDRVSGPTVLHIGSSTPSLKIISIDYAENVHTNVPVRFDVMVQNNEPNTSYAEVDITISNTDTHVESTLTPVLKNFVAAHDTRLFSSSYNISPGTYTVSIALLEGHGTTVDQRIGPFPLRVGNEEEPLNVVPEVINLGPLPSGRYMYPVPIEVRWTSFQFNRQNRDQPFVIRTYTDNATRYQGIPGALHRLSAAGLVSMDGKYVIPLRIWNLNYGPDTQETGWDSKIAGPPPVDDDNAWIGPPLFERGRNGDAASWVRIPDFSEMTSHPASWRRLIGQDPTDSRYATEANPTGDFTLKSPFTIYLATETGPTAVEGQYATTLVVELWSP